MNLFLTIAVIVLLTAAIGALNVIDQIDVGRVVEIYRPDQIIVEGKTDGGRTVRIVVETKSSEYKLGDVWKRNY